MTDGLELVSSPSLSPRLDPFHKKQQKQNENEPDSPTLSEGPIPLFSFSPTKQRRSLRSTQYECVLARWLFPSKERTRKRLVCLYRISFYFVTVLPKNATTDLMYRMAALAWSQPDSNLNDSTVHALFVKPLTFLTLCVFHGGTDLSITLSTDRKDNIQIFWASLVYHSRWAYH
jgi:hypothetical protein